MLAHVRLEDRNYWAIHTINGFYTEPTIEHYRCHKIWTPSTNSTRICETVKWQPQNFRIPTASRESLIFAAADDLLRTLQSQQPYLDLPPLRKSTTDTLTELAALFHNSTRQTKSKSKKLISPPLLPFPNMAPRLEPYFQGCALHTLHYVHHHYH